MGDSRSFRHEVEEFRQSIVTGRDVDWCDSSRRHRRKRAADSFRHGIVEPREHSARHNSSNVPAIL